MIYYHNSNVLDIIILCTKVESYKPPIRLWYTCVNDHPYYFSLIVDIYLSLYRVQQLSYGWELIDLVSM